ncbi:MAG: hypothetical protein ACOY93_07675 [Bacillota bacterium]
MNNTACADKRKAAVYIRWSTEEQGDVARSVVYRARGGRGVGEGEPVFVGGTRNRTNPSNGAMGSSVYVSGGASLIGRG